MIRTKTLYWIFTALFAVFMTFSSLPDAALSKDAITFMAHLGYQPYFVRFIGVAKLLGVIAILVPGYPRIKEWAYAGLFFDLIGATYSIIATDGLQPAETFMLLPVGLLLLSYAFYHKKQSAGISQKAEPRAEFV